MYPFNNPAFASSKYVENSLHEENLLTKRKASVSRGPKQVKRSIGNTRLRLD